VANRAWIANQETSPVQDGTFQMKVVVSNLFEIFHWIMGIGSEARVIKPEELREMVRGEAMKILEIYEGRGR
jgi:predicted DNA-binding transcriptional regulator YafY